MNLVTMGCVPVCPAVVLPSFNLRALDANTGESILCGSQVTVSKDGEVILDSSGQVTAFGCDYPFLSFGSGSFEISMIKSGYVSWQGSVDVPSAQCGPATQDVTAELSPDGSIGSVSVANSSIDYLGDSNQFDINTSFHVAIQVRDANDVPVPGAPLDATLIGTGSANVIPINPTASNGYGIINFQLRGSVEEILEIGFSLDGEVATSTTTVSIGPN